MTIEAQLTEALQVFSRELRDETVPQARERELISFFAFGPLLDSVHPGRALFSPRQIGIEVPVPQRAPRPDEKLKKEFVCKDLVIWSAPITSTWGSDPSRRLHPLAIVEWKTATGTRGEGSAGKAAARDCEELRHLLKYTESTAEAFSIVVTGRGAGRRLLLRRVGRDSEPDVIVFDSAASGELAPIRWTPKIWRMSPRSVPWIESRRGVASDDRSVSSSRRKRFDCARPVIAPSLRWRAIST